MLADLARFNRAPVSCCATAEARHHGPALGQWLDRRLQPPVHRAPDRAPASAVWSADPGRYRLSPPGSWSSSSTTTACCRSGGRPRWQTISGGSARYVDALLSRFTGRLRLRTPVRTVRRGADGVLVTPRGGEPEPFDEVVLATHSDQALALLADASDAERRPLAAIPYQANEAVLHTDTSILPRAGAPGRAGTTTSPTPPTGGPP